MKTKASALVLFFLAAFSSVYGQTSEDRKVSGYDKITVSGGYKVFLKKGGEGVKIELAKGDMENIITEVKGGTLIVKNKSGVWKEMDAKIYISYEKLNALTNSGSSDITAESPIVSENLDFTVSGSGDIKAAVDCQKFSASISGSADMILSGNAGSFNLSISGSGDINAGDLAVKSCSVSIAGSGDASVNVSDELSVGIAGSGDVTYKGSPAKQNCKVSGSGSIKKI